MANSPHRDHHAEYARKVARAKSEGFRSYWEKRKARARADKCVPSRRAAR